jgi:uncharacterized protein YidB (DUF937 family)
MGLLDNILGSSVPGGNLAKPLTIALLALLASGALHKQNPDPNPPSTPPSGGGGLLDGLGGLLKRFQQSGHGDVINSWIGSGQNQPISPNQLGSALGPQVIKILAQKTGLPEEQIKAQLSQILPGVVDKLTPQGRLPTQAEAAQYHS